MGQSIAGIRTDNTLENKFLENKYTLTLTLCLRKRSILKSLDRILFMKTTVNKKIDFS